MPYHFCTISTGSHLFKVKALCDSLAIGTNDFILHVLVVDQPANLLSERDPKLVCYSLNNINQSIGKRIISKYAGYTDKLRWSLKPVFLNYLLENQSIDKLVYVDNDIAFFSDYSFLFDLLRQHPILLTPHHYPRFGDKKQNWLEANFKVGLFNAGFLGVNNQAVSTLNWWAECCLYRCEKSSWRGLFDDQKYLDLFPVIEPKTQILQHQGCNVAEWNREVCKRGLEPNSGIILINEKWPIVFIHFNHTTIANFYRGEDKLLKPLYDIYLNWLTKYNPNFNPKPSFSIHSLIDLVKWRIWQILNSIN
jgi:hypothetical protein